MTTIAWDGYTLAADSMARCGGGAIYKSKVFELSFGVIGPCAVAGAGDADLIAARLHWLEHNDCWRRGTAPGWPWPEAAGEAWCRIVAVPMVSGDLVVWERQWVPFRVPADQPFAMGSGADFARAAMELGRTAVEAVELAIKLDPDTGGEVQSIDVRPRPVRGFVAVGGLRNVPAGPVCHSDDDRR